MDIDSLSWEPLTEENIHQVWEMCEKNVRCMSRSFDTFSKASIKSDLFNPALSVVAKDAQDNVAAFFMAILRRSNILRNKRKVAVLKFFVVEKAWQYKGVGTRLFHHLYEKIKNSELKCWRMKFEVLTSQPDYWLPGLDPRHTEAYFFLKKMGFKKKGERINLCVDIDTLPQTPPPAEHKGYSISRASMEDMDELVPLKFMNKGYQLSFWPEETALTFKNDPFTSFIARNAQGKIVGWASHSIHFPGAFGPTGVKKSERGQGLGGVLLDWCLWDIKQMGIKTAKIMWVEGDTVYFYLKARGAIVCEFFWPMRRRI
ncbi:MAG: GNAT family N-acetyltransferase [Promethearchaeota archaeon]|nr:MAG: GNAT family N-acetyltransferase [Candidatus Lokiarchaeota archaeon]